jgi:hypothetical protein
MRKWGILITTLYATILIALLTPGLILFADKTATWSSATRKAFEIFSPWPWFWIFLVVLVGSQAMLLFLSVETSHRRLKPRTHILVSVAITSMLTALLTMCGIWSLGVATKSNFAPAVTENIFYLLACWAAVWGAWGVVFYLYLRNSSAPVTRLASWLLKGSVLELLIAVPCHVMVRRRDDCCAPVYTSFGITTGIAIMLLSFGPGVLLLYKKRLDSYSHRANQPSARGRSAGE